MSKRAFWLVGVGAAIALIAGASWWRSRAAAIQPEYVQRMNHGNALREKGDVPAAIAEYQQALALVPTSVDARLNLANALLDADRAAEAEAQCRDALALDRGRAAAHYLLGCALLRQNRPEPAAQALQQCWIIEPGVPALDFQMGVAQAQLGQYADAARDFAAVVRAVPDHPSAHYQLSMVFRRLGRAEDADREMQEHQRLRARAPAAPVTARVLERCAYTQPLAPFLLAQPDPQGRAVRFVEDNATALGTAAADLRGPLAVLDYDRDGRTSVVAFQPAAGIVLLDNRAGHFTPLGRAIRVPSAPGYRAMLVGDLDNDGFDDVVVLGDRDSRVLKLYAHGQMRDATRAAGLDAVRASAGLLADLDFTGNLDLVVVRADGSGLGVYRNLGNLSFDPEWADSGIPTAVPHATQVATADWADSGVPALFVARAQQSPLSFGKQRARAFAADATAARWPPGSAMIFADLDNDLRLEAVVATPTAIEFVDAKGGRRPSLPLGGFAVTGVALVDFDNDGWLDLVAYGPSGVRIWRNRGQAGFSDVTAALGLAAAGAVDGLVAADFDGDGDTDFITSSASGLRFWRNDGGSRQHQMKLRLVGNRSNGSALGVAVDVAAGNWRTRRIVTQQPVEIGTGAHAQADAVKVHWFDLATTQVDVAVAPQPLTIAEPTLPSGSCPYLYAWNGFRFRFVTDVLGAAPLGLPMNEKAFVPADPEELLVLGDADAFPPRNGAYEIRLTDELREVLYLDEVHLIAIDHPAGTVVYPTSKMLPGAPFPPHEFRILRPLGPAVRAVRSDGADETAALGAIDNQMAGPVRLRRAQLRGLAEPFAITLDFGPLAAERPLVLALTGWIHFGGGMANIAGSIDPTLPFPFPTLEAETPDGSWRKVDVVVGTPAGKTKTILVDLDGKLPPRTRRLRLSAAYELYWDCALLCEKAAVDTQRHDVFPQRADLHARGYSRYAKLPASLPLTPEYDAVAATPPWDRTPSGWFTRYGDAGPLVERWDDRLALLAGGDELAVRFDAAELPPVPAGMTRDFYLHLVGWDKDADFHVEQGWSLEPLPFRGMDDQQYGRQQPPAPTPRGRKPTTPGGSRPKSCLEPGGCTPCHERVETSGPSWPCRCFSVPARTRRTALRADGRSAADAEFGRAG